MFPEMEEYRTNMNHQNSIVFYMFLSGEVTGNIIYTYT